jgi:large-conductance mechanosensitive channel
MIDEIDKIRKKSELNFSEHNKMVNSTNVWTIAWGVVLGLVLFFLILFIVFFLLGLLFGQRIATMWRHDLLPSLNGYNGVNAYTG